MVGTAMACIALLIIPTLIGAAVAWAGEDRYAARVEFLLASPGASGSEAQAVTSLISLLGTRSVLAPVAEEHGESVEELDRRISREQLDGSTLLRVTVEDSSETQALAIASDLADSYQDSANTLLANTEERDLLNARIEELSAQQDGIRAELLALAGATSNADAETARQLQVTFESVQQQIVDVQDRLIDLDARTLSVASPVRVVSEAFALEETVGPSPLRSAAAGLVVGMILAFAFLWLTVRSRLTP